MVGEWRRHKKIVTKTYSFDRMKVEKKKSELDMSKEKVFSLSWGPGWKRNRALLPILRGGKKGRGADDSNWSGVLIGEKDSGGWTQVMQMDLKQNFFSISPVWTLVKDSSNTHVS